MTGRKRTANPYRIEGDVAILSLTQGQETVIDVADLPQVLTLRWCATRDNSGKYYAATSDYSTGRYRSLRLHRVILNAMPDTHVDHKNHDTLDNRRCNLRLSSPSQNAQNRAGADQDSVTGIRGVSVYRKQGYRYYRASACSRGRRTTQMFPCTPEGLAQAAEAVVQMRLALMTHSDGR